jgi:hypothetical protein
MAGGTSVAARACQQNGWQTLVRQDYTGFKNTGDCVSYAARGGLLGVSLPQLVFHNDAEGFYVTVPLTPHVKTTLYGVTDYPQTDPITHDVTVRPDMAPSSGSGTRRTLGSSWRTRARGTSTSPTHPDLARPHPHHPEPRARCFGTGPFSCREMSPATSHPPGRPAPRGAVRCGGFERELPGIDLREVADRRAEPPRLRLYVLPVRRAGGARGGRCPVPPPANQRGGAWPPWAGPSTKPVGGLGERGVASSGCCGPSDARAGDGGARHAQWPRRDRRSASCRAARRSPRMDGGPR